MLPFVLWTFEKETTGELQQASQEAALLAQGRTLSLHLPTTQLRRAFLRGCAKGLANQVSVQEVCISTSTKCQRT